MAFFDDVGSFVSNASSAVGNFLGNTVGAVTGAKQQGEAAQQAAQTQYQGTLAGIEEQRRQFDALMKLMSPYVTGGQGAFAGQQALIGLQGAGAQQKAIDAIAQSPELGLLTQQGENAMLQNASATGGLRGGNLQAALAQFRPQLLNSLINQQYQRLGGLSQLGQASAAGQASAGLQTGENVANLINQGSAALAGGQVAQGGVTRQAFGDLLRIGATAKGLFG